MPRGDMLLLGNVLMNYAHHLTLLVREQLFQSAPGDTELIIELSTLDKTQCETRKWNIDYCKCSNTSFRPKTTS